MTDKRDPDRKPQRIPPLPTYVVIQPALPGFNRYFAPYPWGPRQDPTSGRAGSLAPPTNCADTTIDTHPTGPPAHAERTALP